MPSSHAKSGDFQPFSFICLPHPESSRRQEIPFAQNLLFLGLEYSLQSPRGPDLSGLVCECPSGCLVLGIRTSKRRRPQPHAPGARSRHVGTI